MLSVKPAERLKFLLAISGYIRIADRSEPGILCKKSYFLTRFCFNFKIRGALSIIWYIKRYALFYFCCNTCIIG